MSLDVTSKQPFGGTSSIAAAMGKAMPRLATFAPAPILIAIVLLSGGAIAPHRDDSMQPPAPTVMHVAAVSAQLQPGYDWIHEFVGRVEPRRQSWLSFEQGGLVTQLFLDEGDYVEKDALIAVMDAQVLETRRVSVAAQLQAAKAKLEELIAGPRREVIEAAQADVHRWQAQAALAAATQDRNRKLFLTKAVSRQELDDATFGQSVVDAQLLAAQARLLELQRGTRAEQIAAQRAAVAQTQAELSTIDVQLAKSKLRAPFAGVIAARQVDDGTVIKAGTPVVELLETSHLEVRVGVTEDVLRQLVPGADQQVFIGEQPHTAVVRAIRPDRDQQTRTISVLLALPLRQPSVRVGDLATVRFTAREHQPGFWLPTSALTEGYRGLWGCYVAVPRSIVSDSAGRKSKPRVASANETSVQATHQLQRRELEVIHHQTEVAFVRGSLNDGELVVPVGLQRLVPGQLVRLASETSE